ncbi:MAG: hypothetical protein QXI19_13280 [Candidatus Caldarchaeum sp.]
MARIPHVEKESAPPDVRAVYQQVEKKFGMVPNVLKAMANSPEVLLGPWGSELGEGGREVCKLGMRTLYGSPESIAGSANSSEI